MDTPTVYQIRVKGHLDEIWKARFDGLTVINLESGDALLSGSLPDQAALYGILYQINNLGLVLISVNGEAENL